MSEFQLSQKKIDDNKKIPWVLISLNIIMFSVITFEICNYLSVCKYLSN